MKIPVIIISGFLGSGKTTLLLKLIETAYERGIKPAILMNELGQQDVDGSILSQANQGLPIEKLLDGCICCSKKSEIAGALGTMIRQAPDIIFIELTGVANPEEVVDEMSEPQLMDQIYLDKIITIIDAEHVMEYNSIFSSDKQLVRTLRRQIEVADILLINKIDLVPATHVHKVTKLTQRYNESAKVITTVNTQMDYHSLLQNMHPLQHKSRAFNGFKVITNHVHTKESSTTIEHASFSKIQSIYIPIEHGITLSARKLEQYFKGLGTRLLRAKGYVAVNSVAPLSLIQFAGKQLRQQPTTYNGPQYIVIIGYDLDRNHVYSTWEQLA